MKSKAPAKVLSIDWAAAAPAPTSTTTTPIQRHLHELQLHSQIEVFVVETSHSAASSKASKQNSVARRCAAVSCYRSALPLSCPRRSRARFVLLVGFQLTDCVCLGLVGSGLVIDCLTLRFLCSSFAIRSRGAVCHSLSLSVSIALSGVLHLPRALSWHHKNNTFYSCLFC